MKKTHTAWIEPLSHGLRHPNSLCGRGADIVDRNYLLLAFTDNVRAQHSLQCGVRKCQAIYFDLGASTWNTGAGGPSQSWFVETYAKHGIQFDRFLLWEAQHLAPKELFKDVPKDMFHKYQYFNIPANADSNSADAPVHILQTIAKPGDFVVFKLDIDNPAIENAILKSIMSKPEILGLVDEFIFEHHVKFEPMLIHWRDNIDHNMTLAGSYKVFSSLRQAGIRAHSWV